MNTRDLANQIAKELFTCGGSKTVAYRLALMDRSGRELSGWGQGPAIDKIEEVIDGWFTKRHATGKAGSRE